MTLFSDKALSQKLERTEGRISTDLVEARKILFPEVGAEWIEVAGTYAMYDGIESPLTQTFGLGVLDEITDVELNEIEAFFKRLTRRFFMKFRQWLMRRCSACSMNAVISQWS